MEGGIQSLTDAIWESFLKGYLVVKSFQAKRIKKKMMVMMMIVIIVIVIIIIVTILMTVYCVPVRSAQILLFSSSNSITRQAVQCSFNGEETRGFKK